MLDLATLTVALDCLVGVFIVVLLPERSQKFKSKNLAGVYVVEEWSVLWPYSKNVTGLIPAGN